MLVWLSLVASQKILLSVSSSSKLVSVMRESSLLKSPSLDQW